MQKYMLIISYKGREYYGYSKQPKLPTIQGFIENILGVDIQAAGRTDRYVNAKGQVISCEFPKKLTSRQIRQYISRITLESEFEISVVKFSKVKESFHPRFQAKGKRYKYVLYNKEGAKDNVDKYFYHHSLDIEKIRSMATTLVGTKDFASFTGKETYKSYERTVSKIKIRKGCGKKVIFIIEGKGFLRFQVRNMVGSLLAYDREKYSKEEFLDLLENPVKGKSHYKVPGKGLTLVKVFYDKKDLY